MLAPPEEAPSEQDEDMQTPREHMTVQERQEKLLEKLNLDGLKVMPHRPNPPGYVARVHLPNLGVCSVSSRHNSPGTPGMGGV